MSKREKIKDIILNDCCGWTSTETLLEKLVDNIYCKLENVSDNYEELLSV